MPLLFAWKAKDQIEGDANTGARALRRCLVHIRDTLVRLIHVVEHIRRGRLGAEADVANAALAEQSDLTVGHLAQEVGGSLEGPLEEDS